MNGTAKVLVQWVAVCVTIFILLCGFVYGYATLNHRVDTLECRFARFEDNQQKALADLNKIKGHLGIPN